MYDIEEWDLVKQLKDTQILVNRWVLTLKKKGENEIDIKLIWLFKSLIKLNDLIIIKFLVLWLIFQL